MKDYGKQRSTVKPEPMVIDEFSVWVHSNIVPISEPGVGDQEGFNGFEFDMAQFTKDEFIKEQSKQMTDTQIALTEVYEMLLV